MTALKLVHTATPAPSKPVTTPAQRRQRELAWLLYVSEGAIANMDHALAVNCVTFDDRDEAVVRTAMASIERAAQQLRKRLQEIT